MRSIMFFAAILIGLGTVMAQMADKMTATTPAMAKTASIATVTSNNASAGVRSLSIGRDARGHFSSSTFHAPCSRTSSIVPPAP